MKVTVKTIDAQSIQLDVSEELTVKELKTAILEKLNATDKQIRLIWRGKVLNDDKKLSDYASDELMLHLVYKAPPREDETPSGNGQEPSGEGPPTVQHTQEVVFLQSVPTDIQANISQITQSLVDHVVGTLHAQGASGRVTATASCVDSTGRTERAQITASTSDSKPAPDGIDAPPTQSTPSQPPPAQTPAAEPAQSTPSQATPPKPSAETKSTPKPSEPTIGQPKRTTPVEPTTTSSQSSRQPPPTEQLSRQPPPTERSSRQPERSSRRSLLDDSDDEGEQERRERAQEYRTQKNIRGHVKTAYKCLQHADRVLLRYNKAVSRADGSVAMDTDRDDITPLADVERVLAVNNGTTSVTIYVSLLDYQEQLRTRARPLIERLRSSITRSLPHEESEAWREAQTAQTVRDFNYYMGHASVSMSRLHVNMFSPPPRVIVSTAPKTTEMRNIMAQMRSMHAAAAPRQPSGYIIEISHKDETGQERTTRATLNTGGRSLFGMGGLGGGLGRMGGLGGGLGGLGGMGGGLGGLGGGLGGMGGGLGGLGGGLGGLGGGLGGGPNLGPPGGLREYVQRRREEREREAAEKKKTEEEEAKRSGEASAKSGDEPTAMETEQSMPSSSRNGSKSASKVTSSTRDPPKNATDEQMDTSEPQVVPDSVKAKTETGSADSASSTSKAGQSSSKDSDSKTSASKKSDGGEEGGAKGLEGGGAEGESERELTDTEKEIPDYLARLVAHIVAGTSMEPQMDEEEEGAAGEGASGGSKEGEKKEEKELTFAQRFAGPVGTKVTIRQPPQPAMFPGMAPVEGPSITIHNPGGGAEPEMTVNFPMPPALQFLRNLLMRDSDSDSDDEDGEKKDKKKEDGEQGSKKNEEDTKKEEKKEDTKKEEKKEDTKKEKKKEESTRNETESGNSDKPSEGSSGSAEERPSLFRRRKPPTRKPDEEPSQSDLWGEDKDEVQSISDAGSLDSIDSDHEMPTLVGPEDMDETEEEARPQAEGGTSMLDTVTQLRQRYAGLSANTQEEDEDIGMVERLLQDISKELSVLEVMSVFNGDTAPLGRLQPILREFIREKLLYGDMPTLDGGLEERAVRAFVRGCLSSLRAVEDQLPLRDTGINFPVTVYRFFHSQFKAAYRIIIREYTGEDRQSQFALLLSHWAHSTSALFGQVLRHCINGDQYFEDLVKMLVNTLFPPTTPPLILNMCNSTIHKQLAKVKSRPNKSPQELDSYLVWKEGATPTPNRSYDPQQFLAHQSEFSADMPTTFLHHVNPDGVECKVTPTGAESGDRPPPGELPKSWKEAAKRDKRSLETGKVKMSFSDAYLSGMPAKKRKLDMSEPQTVPADSLVQGLVGGACNHSNITPQGATTNEEVVSSVLQSSHSLAAALREDIHRGISRRLAEDSNFNREQYPNSCEYFDLPPKDNPET